MAIELINLGTAPKGTDGDTQRTANQKMNKNISYLDGVVKTAQSAAAAAKTAAESASAAAEAAFAKTGGDITGATRVTYAGGTAGAALTIDNTSGTRGSLDIAVNGVPKGGLSLYKQGVEYIASITGTPTDRASDNRQGLMTLSKGSVWTQAYGNLHDYFVKKNTTDAIRTIGEGFASHAQVESAGFGTEIRNRGTQLFIREVFGHYAESVLRTYVVGGLNRDFLFRYDGNAYAPGSWLTYSDIRLKQNITPLAGIRELLDDIQPIHYTRNGQESIGYSAQEIQRAMPCCVRVSGRATDADGNDIEDALALDYSAMTAFNTQLIKEQEAVIRGLMARVLQLEKALGIQSNA